ncbi:lens epithelium-derived growth factor isoform X2 [Aethina tumida]|uniref:lens epithelium-derived growth factor isoform X2 n=1 Tax=Aethina tumida TaxID=116153 RepID=UPI0021476900|nr:lens epithelium-derived growth factor isoform X2 [Aethina tumida]
MGGTAENIGDTQDKVKDDTRRVDQETGFWEGQWAKFQNANLSVYDESEQEDSDLDENEKIRPCEAGDRIIVKMKGLPAWPAKIKSKNGDKFIIEYYGTYKRKEVLAEHIFYPYKEHKHLMVRRPKIKIYKRAIQEIEAEIKAYEEYLKRVKEENMKLEKTFNAGDKVFAKIKGYPPWPAHVQAKEGKKYKVKFFGTGEIGSIKPEDLFYFNKHKATMKKTLKRKEYNDAFMEIEEAILKAGGDGSEAVEGNTDSTKEPETEEKPSEIPKKNKRKRVDSDSNPVPAKVPHISADINDDNAAVENDKQHLKGDIDKEEENPVENTNAENKEAETNQQHEQTEQEKTELNDSVDTDKGQNKSLNDTDDMDSPNESQTAPETENEAEKPSTEENAGVSSPIEDKVTPRSLNILTEAELQRLNLYAEYAAKESEKLNEKTPELPIMDYNLSILPVKLNNDVYAGIKATILPAGKFKTEYDRAVFEGELASKMLEEKKNIERSGLVKENDYIVQDLKLSEDDIIEKINEKDINKNKLRLKKLKDERRLVEIEDAVKNCLGMDNVNVRKALDFLDEMQTLDIDYISLLKHYSVTEMIKRLRTYVGNYKVWNLSEESLNAFRADAQKVRERADKIYKWFQTMFPETNYEKFWDYFTDTLNKFSKDCVDMDFTEAEFITITSHPKSRDTFLTRLEEKDMNAALTEENPKETEKENSSDVANEK